MKYVVRFQRIPTTYSVREALIVEAADPVAAVKVVRDYLLRRGDDPDGFVPNVGRHLRLLEELQRDGLNHPVVAETLAGQQNPEGHLAWRLGYHAQELKKDTDRYVEPYEPVPGRIIGSP